MVSLVKLKLFSLRFRYTFELYLTSEKLFQFGLEASDELHSWTKAIGKVCAAFRLHPPHRAAEHVCSAVHVTNNQINNVTKLF